MKMHRL